MSKKALVFEANRDGYGIEQIRHPMTVGELKEILEDLDDDTLFVLSHDNGYTYGSIGDRDGMMSLYTENDDGEWESAEW